MCGAGEFGKASAISAVSVASLSGGRESTRKPRRARGEWMPHIPSHSAHMR